MRWKQTRRSGVPYNRVLVSVVTTWRTAYSFPSTIIHRVMQSPKSTFFRYGVAPGFVGAALFLSLLSRGFLSNGFLIFFLSAVLLTGWFGRAGPGLLAAFLSMVAVDYFFFPPYRAFLLAPEELPYFLAFLLGSLVTSRLGSARRDAEERQRAHLDKLIEELHKAQAELAHLSRITTMGELASSIAHEVNQPIGAIATNAGAAVRWLAQSPPHIEGAGEALECIVRDANRAAQVIGRIRSLLEKNPAPLVHLDLNEVIREVLILTRQETTRRGTTVRTELTSYLPPVVGDRVQLQQVILNLIMNSLESMNSNTDHPREILVRSSRDSDNVSLEVLDSGHGWEARYSEMIFQPFFTTKKDGIGMGLTISRSLIEAHGGRLWAEPRTPQGAILKIALPIAAGMK